MQRLFLAAHLHHHPVPALLQRLDVLRCLGIVSEAAPQGRYAAGYDLIRLWPALPYRIDKLVASDDSATMTREDHKDVHHYRLDVRRLLTVAYEIAFGQNRPRTKFEALDQICIRQHSPNCRFTDAIKRLTKKLGVTSKYHETITWFYLIKIAERCNSAEPGDWQAFKDANPDLFAWNPSLFEKYYSRDLLSSETARRMFVLPDLES